MELQSFIIILHYKQIFNDLLLFLIHHIKHEDFFDNLIGAENAYILRFVEDHLKIIN